MLPQLVLLAVVGPVEVEARQLRCFVRLPGAWASCDHHHARWGHPALIWRCGLQLFLDTCGICGLTPGEFDARHVKAVCLGDFCKAIAKSSNGNRDHVVTRGEEVDHCALLCTRARGGICECG